MQTLGVVLSEDASCRLLSAAAGSAGARQLRGLARFLPGGCSRNGKPGFRGGHPDRRPLQGGSRADHERKRPRGLGATHPRSLPAEPIPDFQPACPENGLVGADSQCGLGRPGEDGHRRGDHRAQAGAGVQLPTLSRDPQRGDRSFAGWLLKLLITVAHASDNMPQISVLIL